MEYFITCGKFNPLHDFCASGYLISSLTVVYFIISYWICRWLYNFKLFMVNLMYFEAWVLEDTGALEIISVYNDDLLLSKDRKGIMTL